MIDTIFRRKVLAIFGTTVFLAIAPGFVAGLVPWWISGWRLDSPFYGMGAFRFIGGLLIAGSCRSPRFFSSWIPRLTPWRGRPKR